MCLAIPGQIESIESETRLATVDVMGVRRKVNIDLLREEHDEETAWLVLDQLRGDPRVRMLGRG